MLLKQSEVFNELPHFWGNDIHFGSLVIVLYIQNCLLFDKVKLIRCGAFPHDGLLIKPCKEYCWLGMIETLKFSSVKLQWKSLVITSGSTHTVSVMFAWSSGLVFAMLFAFINIQLIIIKISIFNINVQNNVVSLNLLVCTLVYNLIWCCFMNAQAYLCWGVF